MVFVISCHICVKIYVIVYLIIQLVLPTGKTGWYGDACVDENACETRNVICQNSGTCHNLTSDYKCNCLAGWVLWYFHKCTQFLTVF